MRIAFDGTTLRPGRTGVGYYTEHLLHHLAHGAADDELDRRVEPRRSTRRRRCRRGCGSRRSAWRVAADGLDADARAARCCGEVEADVVHFTNGMVPLASPVPTVVTIHDMSLHALSALPPAAPRAAQPAAGRSRGAPRRRRSSRCRESAKRDIVAALRPRSDARARRPRSRGAVVPVACTIRPSSSACASATAWPIASSCTSARSSRARTCRC